MKPETVSYATDIKPLFRPRDIAAMRNFGGFDLSKYDDVVKHADSILARLKAGDMPCDGSWLSSSDGLTTGSTPSRRTIPRSCPPLVQKLCCAPSSARASRGSSRPS
jgi:hypothetical protein